MRNPYCNVNDCGKDLTFINFYYFLIKKKVYIFASLIKKNIL